MFGDMGAAMQAMATIDFDKLAAMPDKIDDLIHEQRITNVLLARQLAAIRIIGDLEGSRDADEILDFARIMVDTEATDVGPDN